MRLHFVTAVLCLTTSLSTVQAQTNSNNDGRDLAVSPSRFRLSEIDKKVIKEFNGAWQQCVLGTKDIEAVVLLLREPDGSTRAVSAGRSTQAYQFTFRWNPAIIAVFHTHPNNRNPKPVTQDILVARRFDVPIFTLTRRGMFMYDPVNDRISIIKAGTDWLEFSSWTQESDLAAINPSQRNP